MIVKLIAEAWCNTCDWTAGPSEDQHAVDLAAEKHTKATKHGTHSTFGPRS